MLIQPRLEIPKTLKVSICKQKAFPGERPYLEACRATHSKKREKAF
jgi:hypothetical protein